MKIKLDENLHIGLAEVFTAGDYDVETVADEGLLGADDATVSRAAAVEERLIITLDRGFGDLRRKLSTPSKRSPDCWNSRTASSW